jgi:4a-hydroxytetrahydrobiopterin dehydratase
MKLAEQHCLPSQAPEAMTAYEIGKSLALLQGWTLVDGAIEKTFAFANYHETIAFVNALAWIVHREDHHPDLAVSFNRCAVRFNTHTVAGLTRNDFICAAKLDALLG